MKIKKILMAALSATLVFGAMTVSAMAEEHQVNSEDALTQAMNDAAAGDTIQFTDSFKVNSQITVPNKTLTFDLNEKTISGATPYKHGIFEITGGNITIRNGTIKIVDDSYQARGAVRILSSTAKGVRVVLDELVIDGSEENLSTCVSNEAANPAKDAQVEIKSGVYYGRYQYPICCNAKNQLKFGKDVVVLSSDGGLGLVNSKGCPWVSSGTVDAIYPEDEDGTMYEPEVTNINGYNDGKNNFPSAETKLVFVKFDPNAPEKTLRLKETAKMYATIQDVVDDGVKEGYLDMKKESGSEEEPLPKSTIPNGVKITLSMVGSNFYYHGGIHVEAGGELVLSGNGANTGVLGDLTWDEGAKISFGNYVYGTYKSNLSQWLPNGKAMKLEEDGYYHICSATVGVEGENTTYGSITDAVAKGQKNIKLLGNHTENVVIGSEDGSSPVEVTINLNGFTLSGDQQGKYTTVTINKGAKVKIVNNGTKLSDGELFSRKSYYQAKERAVVNHGTLTLEGLTIRGSDARSYGSNKSISQYALVTSDGDLTINDCNIENSLTLSPGGEYGAMDPKIVEEDCDGGLGVLICGGTANIVDTTIKAGFNCVYATDCAEDAVKISGDKTLMEWYVGTTGGPNIYPPDKSGRSIQAVDAKEDKMIQITGGKYTSNVQRFVPEGYVAVNTDSGTSGDICTVYKVPDTTEGGVDYTTKNVTLLFHHDKNKTDNDNEYEIAIDADSDKSIANLSEAKVALAISGEPEHDKLIYKVKDLAGTELTATDGVYTFKVDPAQSGGRVIIGTIEFIGYGVGDVTFDQTNKNNSVTAKKVVASGEGAEVTYSGDTLKFRDPEAEPHKHENEIDYGKLEIRNPEPRYNINVSKSLGGTVTVEGEDNEGNKSKKGKTITLTVTPDEEYNISGEVTVVNSVDEDEEIDLTHKEDGTYTFTMPEYDVTVRAAFIKKNSHTIVGDVTVGDATVADGVTGLDAKTFDQWNAEVQNTSEIEARGDEIDESTEWYDAAKEALENHEDDVFIHVITDIKLTAKEYDAKTKHLKVDVSAYQSVYASTEKTLTKQEIAHPDNYENVAVLSSEKSVPLDSRVKIVIPLPESFATDGQWFKIAHKHNELDYTYYSKVTDGAITFRANGLTDFDINLLNGDDVPAEITLSDVGTLSTTTDFAGGSVNKTVSSNVADMDITVTAPEELSDIEVNGEKYTNPVNVPLNFGTNTITVKIGGTIYTINVFRKTVESMSVYFKPTENARKYDIVLKAPGDELIHRLNTADLTFKLTSKDSAELADNDDVAYHITSAADIDLIDAGGGRYEFHFKNKDGFDKTLTDTQNMIKLGTVEFIGYSNGEVTFQVDETAGNIVHATEADDSIVSDYVVDGKDHEKGTLKVNGENVKLGDVVQYYGIITKTFGSATREVQINVMFPNEVVKQSTAYTAMNVTVAGGAQPSESGPKPFATTIPLGNNAPDPGEDGNDVAEAEFSYNEYEVVEGTEIDNATGSATGYKVTLNVPVPDEGGYRYTFTFDGEGYRTYSVDGVVPDKAGEPYVVTVWNNAMDKNTHTVLKSDGFGAKTTDVTFLAGDIIENNKIDLYDLSAVVAYFGKPGLTDIVGENQYIQYDLNRDGQIDSKDIAMVLVSWNK